MLERLRSATHSRLVLLAVTLAIVAVAAGVGLALGFRPDDGKATASVDLSVGDKGIVDSGPLAEIVSKASSMAGFTVEIPDPLPASGYVSSIVIPPGPGGQAVTTGSAAQVYIKVPSGEYIIDELKGTIGGTGRGTEMPELESPGKKVFGAPSAGGPVYLVVGTDRSFELTAGSSAQSQSAAADLQMMIRSLSVD